MEKKKPIGIILFGVWHLLLGCLGLFLAIISVTGPLDLYRLFWPIPVLSIQGNPLVAVFLPLILLISATGVLTLKKWAWALFVVLSIALLADTCLSLLSHIAQPLGEWAGSNPRFIHSSIGRPDPIERMSLMKWVWGYLSKAVTLVGSEIVHNKYFLSTFIAASLHALGVGYFVFSKAKAEFKR